MTKKHSAARAAATRGPSPEKTERTRSAILNAAHDEFIRHGFSAGKIQHICKKAGVSRGTVYHYFPTKESLFENVLKVFITSARVELQSHQRQEGESIKDLFMRTLLPVMATLETSGRAQIARLVILESAQFPALAEAYVREVHQPLLDDVQKLLQIAVDEGELKDPRLVQFPQLIMAPNWLGMVHNGMLNPAHPLDLKQMFEANLMLLFSTMS